MGETERRDSGEKDTYKHLTLFEVYIHQARAYHTVGGRQLSSDGSSGKELRGHVAETRRREERESGRKEGGEKKRRRKAEGSIGNSLTGIRKRVYPEAYDFD